jgi:two-component system sensor histidine kinase AlgZ
VSILSQNSIPDALPDFRNLGVAARILVLVNLAAFLAAAIKANTLAQLVDEFLEIALIVEPVLIASLVIFSAAGPWLARLAYLVGLAIVSVVVLWLTALAQFLRASVDAEPLHIIRAGSFALLLTGFLAGYFHLRSRAFSPALAEARLQALQARIRPHFLFNTLNSIAALIREDPARAEAMTLQLSALFRYTLQAPRAGLVTLGEELVIVQGYLAIEQERLGGRLTSEVNVDAALHGQRIPALTVQPLVENAIKHGIAPYTTPGRVKVSARRQGEMLLLTIDDTGPGPSERAMAALSTGIGVANTRARLGHQFGSRFRFEFQRHPGGFTVLVAFPFRQDHSVASIATFVA